jgi:transcriptional regulator with XRE-family HTH domain
VSQDPAETLGEYIRRQRELHELSMRQVAQMAGISNPYLSQIERGLREPSERVMEAIARTLELSAEKLYEQAGWSVPGTEDEDDSEVESAIEADSRLTARQRQALLEVYRSFTGRRAPRTRRP